MVKGERRVLLELVRMGKRCAGERKFLHNAVIITNQRGRAPLEREIIDDESTIER